MVRLRFRSVFFFNDPATTEIYTLSLHDALPICRYRTARPLAGTGAVRRPQGSARIQHHVRKLREPTGNNGHNTEPLAPRRPAARASHTATGRSSRWSLTSGNADEHAI